MDQQSKKIKVVIIINDFLVGGAQRLTAELVTRFDREKFDVALITLFQLDDRATMYHLLPDWVPVYRLRCGGFADIAGWLSLVKVLKKEKPDVVLSHLFFSNTLARILGYFFRYRCITVEHNTYVDKARLQILLDRWLARSTYKIVAVSQAVKDFTARQERLDESKFAVIKNGIDVSDIMRRASAADALSVRRDLGVPAERTCIITVGRLTPQKNFPLLVEGFSLFARQYPTYDLLIVGGGGLEQEIKAQVRHLGMEDKVHVLGSQKDVAPYLATSDFFVSTSAIEGLSMAHLEALACGLPLLATHTAGSDELVKNGSNGFFIEDRTSESVCKGLAHMAYMDVAPMKEQARKTAQQYDIQTTVKEYEAIIDSAVEK